MGNFLKNAYNTLPSRPGDKLYTDYTRNNTRAVSQKACKGFDKITYFCYSQKLLVKSFFEGSCL